MSDIKVVDAVPAIGFSCATCGHFNYETDSLERADDYNDCAIEADVIQCERCGADNKVIRYI